MLCNPPDARNCTGNEDRQEIVMKSISRFIGTTILGGVLFLAPIVALALVLNKAYVWAKRGLQPMAALIPDRFASTPTMTAIVTMLVLALACFLAGLLAKTLLAQKIVGGLEGAVLSAVPGYEYMKQAGTSVLGLGEMDEHPLVLVRIGDSWRFAVQTGSGQNGFVAVFIPNSPNPLSGSVFLVPSDHVRPATAPLASAIACLRRCGVGASSLTAAIGPPR
jgi:uncharacterized membrane protein